MSNMLADHHWIRRSILTVGL